MGMPTAALALLRPALKDASGQDIITWPEVAAFFVVVFFVLAATATIVDIWKTKRHAGHEDALRELVNRYEQLATGTMDAQQRAAADVSELRSRTASIEQILRTVE